MGSRLVKKSGLLSLVLGAIVDELPEVLPLRGSGGQNELCRRQDGVCVEPARRNSRFPLDLLPSHSSHGSWRDVRPVAQYLFANVSSAPFPFAYARVSIPGLPISINLDCPTA